MGRSGDLRRGVHACIMALTTAQCKPEVNELDAVTRRNVRMFPHGVTTAAGLDCTGGQSPPTIYS
jgi:hypothetical protein